MSRDIDTEHEASSAERLVIWMGDAPPRVLLIGKDARTDAIAAACAASPSRPELFAMAEMYIPGLVAKCGRERVKIGSLTDTDELMRVVDEVQPDLVIIGPEEPLGAGFVDKLRERGIPAFGPSQKLARIESSKAWTRELVDRYGIPGNPDYRVFSSSDGLREYIESLGGYVVKPDGLTAGKGVRVSGDHLHSIDEGVAYAEHLLLHDGCVQVEERLEGQEFSLQTITDGEKFIHCPLVQDHKRAFEGDQGPNTGGMGSYSCPDFSLPFLEEDELAAARSINEKVIAALERDTGEPYRGVLYGGFMATPDGVRLIEYNCRFGDPEAMNVLPLLDADFVELCFAVASGRLRELSWAFRPKATVCKYVVPASYPDKPRSAERQQITVPAGLSDSSGLRWFWAACEQEADERICLTSSRSGAFVGIGDSIAEAEALAERAASELRAVNPVRHRPDIGRADVIEQRVESMRALRAGSARHLSAHR